MLKQTNENMANPSRDNNTKKDNKDAKTAADIAGAVVLGAGVGVAAVASGMWTQI